MASKAVDQFARPDSYDFGLAETGQPWKQHRGGAQIKNGRAVFTPGNPGAIYTVDIGAGGGSATVYCDFLSSDGGGQALYFRVRDVNHWWRLSKRKNYYTYQYVSGYTDPIYEWVGNGTYYYEPAGDWVKTGEYALDPSESNYGTYKTVYSTYDERVSTYLGRQDYAGTKAITYQWRTVYENQTYTQVGGGDPIYSEGTGIIDRVMLEKCSNGIITPVQTVSMPYGFDRLMVHANDDVIDCYANGVQVWDPITDPTHKKETRHGIGYDEGTGYNNSYGIESFYATPSVLSGYFPHVML